MARALIVDDSRTACAILARKLKQFGIESDSCYSGPDALEFLKTKKPSVIFMDHTMPGMDGLQAIKLIKENPLTARIPVLMYTSKQGEYYVGQARALGAMDVLPKELGSAYIQQALNKLGLLQGQSVEVTDTQTQSVETLDSKDYSDQISPRLKHQLYLTTEEMQHTIEEQSLLVMKTLRKQMVNETIEVSQKFDQQLEVLKEVERSTQQRSRWSMVVSFMAVAAVAFLVFTGPQVPEETPGLTAEIEQLKIELAQQFEQQSLAIEEAALAESGRIGVDLVDASGKAVGSVLYWDERTAAATVINDSDFIFKISPDGVIRTGVPRRFFLSQDCVGDAWVEAFPNQVFTSRSGDLWYTPKNSGLEYFQPNSTLSTEGKCERYPGPELALRELMENDPQVTGIQSYRFEALTTLARSSLSQ